ncbi:MAG: VanZ family protein [Clostridia bacterium]|nr:VanZ family protein [Clostridia bacterium]MBQ4602866.1 VanZ family protein [Clostridia bacterium]
MKKLIISILLWLLVAGWIAFIFSMSAQPAELSDKVSKGALEKIYEVSHEDTDSTYEQKSEDFIEINHSTIRRAAHFVMFMVLAILVSVASLYSFNKPVIRFSVPVIVSVIYPFVDELFQLTVPGRAFEWNDVGLDILGGILGCAFVYLIYFASGKLNNK